MADVQSLFERWYNLHVSNLEINENSEVNRDKIPLETRSILNEFRANPLIHKVISNPKTTLFEEAEKLRRTQYGGLKKYLPRSFDMGHNLNILDLSEIVPNASHLMTSQAGRFMPDNPITGAIYGILAGAFMYGDSTPLHFSQMEALTEGAEAGILLGLSLNFLMRNRKHFRSRKDFDNARLWDTLQFNDMIIDFMRTKPEALSNLKGEIYTAPAYESLSYKQRELAYSNMFGNPFIKKMGVLSSVAYGAREVFNQCA